MADRAAQSSNLKVFLRTSVVATATDGSGRIKSISCVQRTPKNATNEWDVNLSEDIVDWYSPEPSDRFDKYLLSFTGSIFIEATELGDILATSNESWAQGVEIPTENSFTTDSTCG